MTDNIKYNCVFGGGGVRGVCYVGVVKALEELNVQINSIAGSSVGAVFAMLYAIGYNAEEIKNFFMDFNFNMFRDINLHIFDGDISLSRGGIFLEWLREKIEQKYYGENYKKGDNAPVYFKDIEKDLLILTLDINSNTPYIFSKETTPDEEIALAVRISAGLPLLMKPFSKDNNILIDGDLIKSRPAFKIFDKLNNPDTRMLELRLEGTRCGNKLKSPTDYINSVISTIWYLSTEYIYDLYHTNDRYDFIITDTKDIVLFDFTLDKTQRENLIEKGYKTTKYYFTNTLKEKKQAILLVYKRILSGLRDFEKSLMKNNFQYSLFVLNEILSNMVEDTKYIDYSVYENLVEIKNLLISSKKSGFLFNEGIEKNIHLDEKILKLYVYIEKRISNMEEYIKSNGL